MTTGDPLMRGEPTPGTTVELLFIDVLTNYRNVETLVVPEQGLPEQIDHDGKAYLRRPHGGQGRPYWYLHAGGREQHFRSYSHLRTDSPLCPCSRDPADGAGRLMMNRVI